MNVVVFYVQLNPSFPKLKIALGGLLLNAIKAIIIAIIMLLKHPH